MSHKSEAEFGRALDKGLTLLGYDIHNIQTPTTERGCPDRYLQRGTFSGWIELKNEHCDIKVCEQVVKYREGQQAWLHRHYKAGGIGITGIAGKDGYLFFLHQRVLVHKIYKWESEPQLFISHLYFETLDSWLQQFKPGMSKVIW